MSADFCRSQDGHRPIAAVIPDVVRNRLERHRLPRAFRLPADDRHAAEQFQDAHRLRRRVFTERQPGHVAAVVYTLDAIHQRPAFQSHPPGVLVDRGVRLHPADGHGEIEFDPVAGSPLAGHDRVTPIESGRGRFSVDS